MENRIIIAGNKYFPVSDINFDIVNFGYQDADPSHRQGPYFKSEHVLQYVLGGRGYYEIHGKRHTVKKGDLFYLPKNVLLAYYADENDPYYYYWIGIDGASAKKLTERTGLTEFSPVKYYGDDEITAFYKEIEKYLNENTFAGHLAATGKAYELMARLLAGNEDNIQKLKSVSVAYADAAIQYIKSHFNEDITVQSIADHIGIGRSYLSVIFSRHTSMPPVEYLVRYRVDQAGKMLKQGLSVTDTAINCGFNSPSHFSVQFKKITGRTPAEFRKRKGQ